MTPNSPMAEAPQKTGSRYKWYFLLTLLVLIVVVVFNYRNMSAYEKNFGLQSKELKDKISKLESENGNLSSDNQAQKRILDFYQPYEPLLRNLKLKDSAYNALPYRYGQRVTILPDTSTAVINAIQITAGAYEYAVKYVVRNASGNYVTVAVTDIMGPSN